jgi:flagellar biosynthesis protein FlhA
VRSIAFGPLGAELLGGVRRSGRSTEVMMAAGVLMILAVLVVPLPPILLDLLLACSISLSVLILITALFIERPLDFNSFPTVLLIATMLRLALNLATTRLILSHGHEGAGAAGNIIEAFGRFLMQGKVRGRDLKICSMFSWA